MQSLYFHNCDLQFSLFANFSLSFFFHHLFTQYKMKIEKKTAGYAKIVIVMMMHNLKQFVDLKVYRSDNDKITAYIRSRRICQLLSDQTQVLDVGTLKVARE